MSCEDFDPLQTFLETLAEATGQQLVLKSPVDDQDAELRSELEGLDTPALIKRAEELHALSNRFEQAFYAVKNRYKERAHIVQGMSLPGSFGGTIPVPNTFDILRRSVYRSSMTALDVLGCRVAKESLLEVTGTDHLGDALELLMNPPMPMETPDAVA